MTPFTTLTAVAAPLPIANVDTDMIIPAEFLKTIKRTGLGVHLFDRLRRNADGSEKKEFPLNRPEYRNAQILIGGENFGCGSSREHAPWALLDFGIRSIIAPSFADIFFNNCFKNGILPVILSIQSSDKLTQRSISGNSTLTIDLEKQTVSGEGIDPIHFDIEPFRKRCLLNGLDDIGLTLEKTAAINAFENGQRRARPWLYFAN
jgi:3-isopropylmalate/(R)-2-methylmalate dehydratase small subunit